jgi:hypothetical protein
MMQMLWLKRLKRSRMWRLHWQSRPPPWLIQPHWPPKLKHSLPASLRSWPSPEQHHGL